MDEISTRKVRNFKNLLSLWSAADSYLFCIFASAPTRIYSLHEMAEILACATGWETSSYEIMQTGERRLQIMRWYNQREGFTSKEDTLPTRFFEQPIADGPRRGDVLDQHRFDSAIKDFYRMMGWTDAGTVTRTAMVEHHLEDEVD